MDRETFARRLREERELAGISQARAARHAGVAQSTWTRYESGEVTPRATRIPSLAAALGIPIARLYDPTAVADVRVTPDTLTAMRLGGRPAIEQVAARIGASLVDTLTQACHPPSHAPRAYTRQQARVSPGHVAQRLANAYQRRADRLARVVQ